MVAPRRRTARPARAAGGRAAGSPEGGAAERTESGHLSRSKSHPRHGDPGEHPPPQASGSRWKPCPSLGVGSWEAPWPPESSTPTSLSLGVKVLEMPSGKSLGARLLGQSHWPHPFVLFRARCTEAVPRDSLMSIHLIFYFSRDLRRREAPPNLLAAAWLQGERPHGCRPRVHGLLGLCQEGQVLTARTRAGHLPLAALQTAGRPWERPSSSAAFTAPPRSSRPL